MEAVAAAAVWGCPGELHKRVYKWVVLTSVNAAICTATDCNYALAPSHHQAVCLCVCAFARSAASRANPQAPRYENDGIKKPKSRQTDGRPVKC